MADIFAMSFVKCLKKLASSNFSGVREPTPAESLGDLELNEEGCLVEGFVVLALLLARAEPVVH